MLSRLVIALRWCAEGSKCDGAAHRIPNAVYNSPCNIVDTIHETYELNISFLPTHAEQWEILKVFKAKPECEFSNCVRAVNGMLV